MNNVKSIFLQSCTANGVSCKWHEKQSKSWKWFRAGWLLWSSSTGSTAYATFTCKTSVKQGKFGIRKGKWRVFIVLVLISESTCRRQRHGDEKIQWNLFKSLPNETVDRQLWIINNFRKFSQSKVLSELPWKFMEIAKENFHRIFIIFSSFLWREFVFIVRE